MSRASPIEILSAEPAAPRQPASQQVADKLLDLIHCGNLKAGDKIPTEHELAAALQVSRPVVREALRGLSIMGVVESRQGGGCYVTDLSPVRLAKPLQFVIAIDESNATALYEARVAVETEMIRLAVGRIGAAQLHRLEELTRAGYSLATDPVGFRVLDQEFHATLMEACGNPFLHRMAASLYELGIEYRRIASELDGVIERSAREHEAVFTALAGQDEEQAVAAMRDHLRSIARSTEQAMAALSVTVTTAKGPVGE